MDENAQREAIPSGRTNRDGAPEGGNPHEGRAAHRTPRAVATLLAATLLAGGGQVLSGCAAGEARREGGTGAVSDDALSRAEENGWEAVDEFTDEPAEAATDAADTTAPSGDEPDATDESPMNDDTEAADAAADAPREAERPASPGAALAVSLRAGAERSAVGTPLEITVTARNTSGEDARLLLWNTPFEPTLSAGMFAVERDGETLPYRGRMLKRSIPPAAGDVVRLIAGDALESVVDLSRYYAVDEPGSYTIRFEPRPVPVAANEDDAPFATLLAPAEEALLVERHRD